MNVAWYACWGCGTPKPIVDKWRPRSARRDSAVTQRFVQDDAAPGQGGPEAFAAFIKKEQDRWEGVVKRANIVVE